MEKEDTRTKNATVTSGEGSAPDWRGSLKRLRRAGCPFLQPVLRDHMPCNAVLVLDHNALNDIEATTIEALTGAGYSNTLVVPELALDFFDADFKITKGKLSTQESGAVETSPDKDLLPSKARIHRVISQQKKKVLLQRDTYRLVVQKVDEYDEALLAKLQIPPKSYDTRLYVLCALYFRKKRQQPTVIVTTDPVVAAMAAEYDLLICPAKDICNCGSLIEKWATEKQRKK